VAKQSESCVREVFRPFRSKSDIKVIIFTALANVALQLITYSRCSNLFSMNLNCLQCIILPLTCYHRWILRS